MSDERPILVTGAAGTIGRLVCRHLAARGHRVRGLDLRPGGGEDFLVGSITDTDMVARAVDGCRCVVHLAATSDEADFMTELLPNNIVGLYRLLEAAARAGVGRLVLASTIQVIIGVSRPLDRPGRLSDGTAPVNDYAATKVFAESLGRVYAAKNKVPVLVARIGWLPRTPESHEQMRGRLGAQSLYLSHDDAVRFFACAVEAPLRGYHLVFVTSRPPEGVFGWDGEPARLAVGYEAEDTYPSGCAFA